MFLAIGGDGLVYGVLQAARRRLHLGEKARCNALAALRLCDQFSKVAQAGVYGLVVDTAVLYLLKDAMGPFYARALSFVVAVFATWTVNRMFAFRERKSALSKKWEFTIYLVLMLVGGAANYGVYSWLVVSYPLVRQYRIGTGCHR